MEHSVHQQQAKRYPFFSCYLLCSKNPRSKGRTYIGFTVNPRRRIRQHNGEIKCGARRTKMNRPWEMILCVYGFPTQVNALQFEWAWKHPVRSLAVREAASRIKPLQGLHGRIKLVYAMLTLPQWRNFDLTVNFMSTKHLQHTMDCLELPPKIKMLVAPINELPCYRSLLSELSADEDKDETKEDEYKSADELVAISERSNLIATKKEARGFRLNKVVPHKTSSLSRKGRKVQSKDCQKKRYLKKLKCSIEDATGSKAESCGTFSPSEPNLFVKDISQDSLKSSSNVK